MEQEIAKQRLAAGGLLLFLGTPDGCEVGLDLLAWKAGPKFKGWKMVPPGAHLVYFSVQEGAPRSSAWVVVERGSVHVFKYDAGSESFVFGAALDEDEDASRHAAAARRMELDAFLGPYPFEHHAAWCALTKYVSATIVQELQHGCQSLTSCGPGLPVAAAGLLGPAPQPAPAGTAEEALSTNLFAHRFAGLPTYEEGYAQPQSESASTAAEGGSSAQEPRPEAVLTAAETGYPLAFTVLPGIGRGSRLCDRTAFALDSSGALAALAQRWAAVGHEEGRRASGGGALLTLPSASSLPSLTSSEALPGWATHALGELQASFVCFLAGQSFDGLEQWKRLADTWCRAEDAMSLLYQHACAGSNALTVLGSGAPLSAAFVAGYETLASQIQALPRDLLTEEEEGRASEVDSNSNPEGGSESCISGSSGTDAPGTGRQVFVKASFARLAEATVALLKKAGGNPHVLAVGKSVACLFAATSARLGWVPPLGPQVEALLQRPADAAAAPLAPQGSEDGYSSMAELLAALAAEGGDGDLPTIVE